MGTGIKYLVLKGLTVRLTQLMASRIGSNVRLSTVKSLIP